MEIPVYLFTGFLDAGKSTFLQGTLEDSRFNDGEGTLVLLCEEGEIELEPMKFSADNVWIETLDEPEDLSPFLLESYTRERDVQRVIVEYNGMWPIALLLQNLPENWVVYQQYTFFDATTFISYNANMRQQVADKLTGTEMIVFNRADERTDKKEIHRLVRALNRRCDILYEYADGSVETDNEPDPLPFDLAADIVTVSDRDFAIWYREMSESPEQYDGKVFKIRGMVVKAPEIPEGSFICGRQLMTCCVEDMQFAGFIATGTDSGVLATRDWVYLTAELKFAYHPVYGQKGPILKVRDIAKTTAPSEPIATFY